MSIREYAKACGHEIVGKLTRRPEWEYCHDLATWEKRHGGCRHYSDEAGNEYIISRNVCCIVTAEGAVI